MRTITGVLLACVAAIAVVGEAKGQLLTAPSAFQPTDTDQDIYTMDPGAGAPMPGLPIYTFLYVTGNFQDANGNPVTTVSPGDKITLGVTGQLWGCNNSTPNVYASVVINEDANTLQTSGGSLGNQYISGWHETTTHYYYYSDFQDWFFTITAPARGSQPTFKVDLSLYDHWTWADGSNGNYALYGYWTVPFKPNTGTSTNVNISAQAVPMSAAASVYFAPSAVVKKAITVQ
jgi:hypothetical protein